MRVSKPQKRLYYLILKHFDCVALEYPIKTNVSKRTADIALIEHKIDIEFDAEYWHKDKDDDKRDRELAEVGWTVLRFNNDNWQTAPEQVERLLKNHNDEYEFMDVEIISVKKITPKIQTRAFKLKLIDGTGYVCNGFIIK